jgi:hypothetical protein
MPTDDFTVIYSGASLQADLLKSLLEGKGVRAIRKDEFLGRMVPYAVPGGVKVLVSSDDAEKARRIVEDLDKDSTASRQRRPRYNFTISFGRSHMNTKTIRQTVRFSASPHAVYELLMDSKKHRSLSGEAARISRKVGGQFSAWNGHMLQSCAES